MTDQEVRPHGAWAPTGRQALKAERRALLLAAAKRLFSQHGFHAVSLGDLGAGAGISAPAVYRHFPSKEAVLSELLVGISEHLHAGGESVLEDSRGDAPESLARLVDFHVAFAMAEPELIRIQDRDFPALPREARARARRLQRRYIGLWSEALVAAEGLSEEEAEIRVRSVFGLINSTPHLGSQLSAGVTRRQLRVAALAALRAH